MTKITKKRLDRYMEVRNEVRIKFNEDIISLPYQETVTAKLQAGIELWLAGNIMKVEDFKDEFASDWEKEIPEEWKNEVLIGLCNNPGGYTSLMVSAKPYKSTPGLYYVKLSELLKKGEFSFIGKILSFTEARKLINKRKNEILSLMVSILRGCINEDKTFNYTKFNHFHEDMYYDVIREVIHFREEKLDLNDVGMNCKTFNYIQCKGVRLLEQAGRELGIDPNAFRDLGIIAISIPEEL